MFRVLGMSKRELASIATEHPLVEKKGRVICSQLQGKQFQSYPTTTIFLLRIKILVHMPISVHLLPTWCIVCKCLLVNNISGKNCSFDVKQIINHSLKEAFLTYK